MIRSAGWDQIATNIRGEDFSSAISALQRLATNASLRSRRTYEGSQLFREFRIPYPDLIASLSVEGMDSGDQLAHLGALLWEADFDELAVAAFREAAKRGSDLGLYELGDALLWRGDAAGQKVLEGVARSRSAFAARAAGLLAFSRIASGEFDQRDVTTLEDWTQSLEKAHDPADETDIRLFRSTLRSAEKGAADNSDSGS